MEKAPRFQQLPVCTLLNSFTVINDNDVISIANRGQPVRDDKAGAALHQPQQRLLDAGFGTRVHAGSCLIQDEDAWVRENRSRNRKQLALSLAKVVRVWSGNPAAVVE